MTPDKKSLPCAIDHFHPGILTFKVGGAWSDWYLYNLALNELVQTHSQLDKENLLRYSFDAPFLGGYPWYFAILGPKKAYYFGRAGMLSGPYLALCRAAFDRMRPIFHQAGGQFAPFVLTYEASKQIALFFRAGPRSDVEALAAQVNSTVIELLSGPMALSGSPFPNLMALSGPIYDLEHTRQAYCQAKELSEMAFFLRQPMVLTRERLEQMRRPAEYETVMERCQDLMDALERGDPEFPAKLERLFLDLLANGLSLARVGDALTCLRFRAQPLLQVYGLPAPGEALFSAGSYLTLWECHQALRQFFAPLLAAIQAQGGYSHCVVRSLDYIRRHSGDPNLSVPEIARYARVTPSYLSRLFSHEVGRAPVEQIKQCRLERARALLEDQGLRIYQVARNAGFSDVKYFTRLFKSVYGLTPNQYREERHL